MSLPENFWLTLICDLSENAPDGPGWYVYAAREGTPLIPLRRVSGAEAAHIGAEFDRPFHADEEKPPVLPTQLIDSGNHLVKDAIDIQIKEAEKVALKLARLRRLRDDAEREDDEESQPS